MIRFENLYINRKEKILNECFDEGTKFIDNESQFNFLKLKKEPKSGFAYIDGIKVSYDGTGEKGFFVLDINSKIFCLSAVFMKEDNFDEIKKEILDELSCLKELPLDDENQKCRKINLILSILTKYYCSYCLIDFNNPINYQNKNLILKCLGHFDQKTVFIVLDKKNDFANKSNQIDEQVNIKNKATLKVGFKQFFEFIKVNILQLLFLT
ncbi:MAG TPA: hypothetical protein DDW20_01800, partial [Firmicutes bacterium]|nr:hypothetical protein [Bacillota bacterium]